MQLLALSICLYCSAAVAFISTLQPSNARTHTLTRSVGRTRCSMEASPSFSRWGAASKQAAADQKKRERILIVGGGFGGLYTALRLSQMPWTKGGTLAPQITLVDKRDKFVFMPLLYELAGTASPIMLQCNTIAVKIFAADTVILIHSNLLSC
jgi:hypothetical protein